MGPDTYTRYDTVDLLRSLHALRASETDCEGLWGLPGVLTLREGWEAVSVALRALPPRDLRAYRRT